ncbi:MAG: very short patch repair endonuclease [Candidatus Angelobacter sp.]
MEILLRKKLKGGRFESVPPFRSAAMSKVRGRGNRTTEMRLRYGFVGAGIAGWRLHPDLPGHPDFFFYRHRIALFVDGCFWHGCPECGHIPKVNRAFWKTKIQRNQQRAKKWDRLLRKRGIAVVHIWECDLKTNVQSVLRKINTLLCKREG